MSRASACIAPSSASVSRLASSRAVLPTPYIRISLLGPRSPTLRGDPSAGLPDDVRQVRFAARELSELDVLEKNGGKVANEAQSALESSSKVTLLDELRPRNRELWGVLYTEASWSDSMVTPALWQ